MTFQERHNPGILNGTRRMRIANGAGVKVVDVNQLLKQFQQMQKMMRMMKGNRRKEAHAPDGGHAGQGRDAEVLARMFHLYSIACMQSVGIPRAGSSGRPIRATSKPGPRKLRMETGRILRPLLGSADL